MKEILINDCPVLKGLVKEITSFCIDCGNKRQEIKFRELPKEAKTGFENYQNKARFLFCCHCKTYSMILED